MCYDVFISHANSDAEDIYAISEYLKKSSISCWVASRAIPPGMDFVIEILKAIEACNAALLVLSINSNESPFVFSEINRAFAKRKPIFTVRLDDVPPAPQLELYVARRHWLDGFPPPLEKRLDALVRSILNLRNASEESTISQPAYESSPDMICDEIRRLSEAFYSKKLDGRISKAVEVADLARSLTITDVSPLCRSEDRGERVAGFISLGVLIGGGIPGSALTAVNALLELGIRDSQSRVRFRAVEAIGCSYRMLVRFHSNLEDLSANDPNRAVRKFAAILIQEQQI